MQEKKDEEMDTDKPLSRAERRMKRKAGAPPDKPRIGGAGADVRQDRREEKRAESKSLRWQRKR